MPAQPEESGPPLTWLTWQVIMALSTGQPECPLPSAVGGEAGQGELRRAEQAVQEASAPAGPPKRAVSPMMFPTSLPDFL